MALSPRRGRRKTVWPSRAIGPSPLALLSFAVEVDALVAQGGSAGKRRCAGDDPFRRGASSFSMSPRGLSRILPLSRGIQPNGCASGGLRRMTWCRRLPATSTGKRCEKWPRIFSRWIVPSFPAWTETGETGRLGRHCRVRPKDELPGDRRRNRAESGTGDGDAPGG